MNAISRAETRDWVRYGTTLVLGQHELSDADLGEASGLPGWTRKHVLAHIAANADALRNLITWAATGEPTPMYASPEDRAAGIERGTQLTRSALMAWLHRSADLLETAMDALGEDQWHASVQTAQGRTVEANHVPWLRAREVTIHAVDLATGISFADLPRGFLAALCEDISTRQGPDFEPALVLHTAENDRSWTVGRADSPTVLRGRLADIAGYLTGRTTRLTTADGGPPPPLAPWL